eukprot:1462764-Prymnesium_polylepis.2
MEVTCPAGVRPGDCVHVTTADGEFEVIVPEGVAPGDIFLVQVGVREEQAPESAANGFHDAETNGVHEADGLDGMLRLRHLLLDASEPGSILHALDNYAALEGFIQQNAAAFEGWTGSIEQRLEWTAMHGQYVALIEERIAETLAQQGARVEQLYGLLSQYLPSPTGSGGGVLLHKLMTMGDYQDFCGMMAAAHG